MSMAGDQRRAPDPEVAPRVVVPRPAAVATDAGSLGVAGGLSASICVAQRSSLSRFSGSHHSRLTLWSHDPAIACSGRLRS